MFKKLSYFILFFLVSCSSNPNSEVAIPDTNSNTSTSTEVRTENTPVPTNTVIPTNTPAPIVSTEVEASLAELIPQNVQFYAEMASGNVSGTLERFLTGSEWESFRNAFVQGTAFGDFENASYTPEELTSGQYSNGNYSMMNYLTNWDYFSTQGLTTLLGQSSTIRDIDAWLGDEIAFAVRLDEADINYLAFYEGSFQPDLLLMGRVDDNAAAKAFVEMLLHSSILNLPPTVPIEDNLNNIQLTMYTLNLQSNFPVSSFSLLLWDGYFALGTSGIISDVITIMRGTGEKLSDSAVYQEIAGSRSSDEFARLYVDGAIYELVNEVMDDRQIEMPLNDLDDLLEGVEGQALILRETNEQVHAVYRQKIDADALESFLDTNDSFTAQRSTTMSDISNAIPADAFGAVLWQDLPQVYNYYKENPSLLAYMIMPYSYPYSTDLSEMKNRVESGYDSFEDAYEQAFGTSIDSLFAWGDGQAAYYARWSEDSYCQPYLPVDHSFLLKIEERLEAGLFLSQLATLQYNVEATSSGLYRMNNGVENIFFGLQGDYLLASYTTTINADNPRIYDAANPGNLPSLAQNPIFQRALQNYRSDNVFPIAFLNLVELRQLLDDKASVAGSQINADWVSVLLRPFESATLGLSMDDSGLLVLELDVQKANGNATTYYQPAPTQEWTASPTIINLENLASLRETNRICGGAFRSDYSSTGIHFDNANSRPYAVVGDSMRDIFSRELQFEVAGASFDSSTGLFYRGSVPVADMTGNYLLNYNSVFPSYSYQVLGASSDARYIGILGYGTSPTINVWDNETDTVVAQLTIDAGVIRSIGFTQDNSRLNIVYREDYETKTHQLFSWDFHTLPNDELDVNTRAENLPEGLVRFNDQVANEVRISPMGNMAVLYRDEGTVVITLNDDRAEVLASSTNSYTNYSFSPDGRYVALTSDGVIIVGDSLEQRVLNFPVNYYVNSIAFHPSQPIMAYTDSTRIYFYNLEDSEAAAQTLDIENVSTVEFSESGTVLILRTSYGSIIQFYQVVSE